MNQNNCCSKSKPITICYWPGRESSYSRNRVLLKAMSAVDLHVLDCSSTSKNLFRYIESFFKFLRSYRKCDVVMIGFLGHFLVPIARLFTRKPIVFDSFVSIYMTMCLDRKKFKPTGILAALSKLIDRKSCQLADIVICDTQEHINFFTKTYDINTEKFIRIWVGTDDSVMHPYPKIIEKENLVHFHGEFQPLHGVENIIKAAALTPEVNFRLIGKGATRKKCEELAASLNLSNVEFFDPVSYEELPKLMSEAAICLGIFGDSVKTESVIPHKIFEAMAVGKPIITADTSAIRELLTDETNVILCKTNNPEEIAATIKKIFTDKDLKELLGKNALNKFNESCAPALLGNILTDTLNTNWWSTNNVSICAVIPTMNVNKQILQEQINRLKPQVNHIYIIDNGSTDPELLNKLNEISNDTQITITFNEANIGIAGALNIGVNYALKNNYDFVLTLDHDSFPDSSMTNQLLNTFKKLQIRHNNRVAIIGPNVTDAAVPHEWMSFKKNTVIQKDLVISSGSLINIKAFRDVGLFHEPLFIYYVDNDFCLRCKERGWKVFKDFSARLIHREGEKEICNFLGFSIIYRKYSALAFYYIMRNLFHMLRRYKHYPLFCLASIKRTIIDILMTFLYDTDKANKFYAMRRGAVAGIKKDFTNIMT